MVSADRIVREMHHKFTPFSQLASDIQLRLVTIYDVVDDGEAQPSPASCF